QTVQRNGTTGVATRGVCNMALRSSALNAADCNEQNRLCSAMLHCWLARTAADSWRKDRKAARTGGLEETPAGGSPAAAACRYPAIGDLTAGIHLSAPDLYT